MSASFFPPLGFEYVYIYLNISWLFYILITVLRYFDSIKYFDKAEVLRKRFHGFFSSFCHSECFALLRTLCVCHSSKSTIMAFEASEEQEEVEEAAHKRENVKCLFCVTSGFD